MANIQPNRYVLQSRDGKIKVDYETSNFIGQPNLNLGQGSGPVRHFAGSQIRSVVPEVGTLITVTTEATPDSGSTSFSVLIPAITLTAVSDHQKFATEAILTSHSGPISIPPTGVHEKYQFVALKGDASFVFALIQSALAGPAKAPSK
jgi:hypothetical protein